MATFDLYGDVTEDVVNGGDGEGSNEEELLGIVMHDSGESPTCSGGVVCVR